MQTFSQFALPGTILASALGAVVLCLVLLMWGFKAEPDDERAPGPRLFLTRLGHAVAAACFALALMFSTVAFIEQRHAAAPPAPDQLRRLDVRLNVLEQRLALNEPQPQVNVAAASPRAEVVATPVAVESRRPVTAPARQRKIASAPKPSARDDFGERAREDWQSVMRGFRETGEDIRSGFVALGNRIKHAFD
jgi:hypothetical protein